MSREGRGLDLDDGSTTPQGSGLITALGGGGHSTWDDALRQIADSCEDLLGDLAMLPDGVVLLAGCAALGLVAAASEVSRARHRLRFVSNPGEKTTVDPWGFPDFVLSEAS